MNKAALQDADNAILAEASWKKDKLSLYMRYEWVQKTTEEFNLNAAVYGPETIFPVNACTLGFNYDLLLIGQTHFALGAQGSFNHAPAILNSLYGKNPLAAEVFIRIYPGVMTMNMKM